MGYQDDEEVTDWSEECSDEEKAAYLESLDMGDTLSSPEEPTAPAASSATDVAACATGGPATGNAISQSPPIPEPLVTPAVRAFCQWEQPQTRLLRAAPNWNDGEVPNMVPEDPKKPNGKKIPEVKDGKTIMVPHTQTDAWAQNGCLPNSLAAMIRWWYEDNPETAGKLDVKVKSGSGKSKFGDAPGPGAKIISPIQVNFWLHGSNLVPCTYDPTEKEWKNNYETVWKAVTPISFNGKPLKAEAQKQKVIRKGKDVEVESVKGLTDEEKLRLIADGLLRGPVLANMTEPGHWVVVHGYRDGFLYLADPGLVFTESFKNGKFQRSSWSNQRGMLGHRKPPPPPGGWLRGHWDEKDNNYVKLTTSPTDTYLNKKHREVTWLSTLIQIVWYYFDRDNIHESWKTAPL
jgi:hypothetical protein